MSRDSFEQDTPLRQGLWGLTAITCVLVIVLPIIFDGGGSESRWRRVEKLREAPPLVNGAGGSELSESMRSAEDGVAVQLTEPLAESAPGVSIGSPSAAQPAATPAGSILQIPALRGPVIVPMPELPAAARSNLSEQALTAWVIQAAVLAAEKDALMLRDRLRAAGYASFVRDRGQGSEPFRVLVGPMIDRQTASQSISGVIAVTRMQPLVLPYP